MAVGKRSIGAIQRHVLWNMISHDRTGVWYPGAEWYWSNTSTTIRIMDSLTRRGLVTKTVEKSRRTEYTYPHYTITDEGRKEAGHPGTLPERGR